MKIRPLVFWVCVFAIALLVLLWFTERPNENPVSSHPPADVQAEFENSRTIVKPTREEIERPSHRKITVKPTLAATNPTPIETKEERTRTVLAELNDVPITFYGRVQDQVGKPVVGAEITGSVIIDNGVKEGTKKVSAISDANGVFHLNGGHGESLGVMPRKEGYALTATQTEFKYSHFYPESRHLPDANNPVVFKMWKLQGGERLVHFQFKARVPCDSKAVRFDLQTSQRVESGGDVIVSVESPIKTKPTEKYNWKALIQPVDGGLIPYTGRMESVFLAPEAGYEPEFVVGFQKDAQAWSSRFNGSFYLKAHGGGIYGKIDVGIITDAVKDGFIPIMASGYINLSGSRNLEIDPALVTEAKP